jgi:hypothetical protein
VSVGSGREGGARDSIRGQVTLFVIVGLVMLLFVAIFFIVFQSNNQQSADQTGIAADLTKNAALNAHLIACIDTIMNDELLKLGDGGGELNFSASRPNVIVGEEQTARRMLFGITQNRDCDGTVVGNCYPPPKAYPAPRYPDDGIDFAHTIINPMSCDPVGDFTSPDCQPFNFFIDGYFGDVHFPAICDDANRNAACTYVGSPPYTTGPSQQGTLLANVQRRIQSCADPKIFNEQTGNNVVEVSPPVINITFTSDVVLVTFSYPLTLRGSTERTTIPINRRYDVRYLSIARFANELAREETRNIDFHISDSSDYKLLPSYRDGFSVSLGRNIVRTSWQGFPQGVVPADADIITIFDAKSKIDNKAYAFNFLVEHRVPMLTVLHNEGQCRQSNAATIAASPDDLPLAISRIQTSPGPPPLYKCTVTADGLSDWQDNLS